LVENNQPIVQMPKQFKPQVTIQEEMNIKKRTISKITKIMWNSSSEETIFTCQGKIINIDIDNSDWHFISTKYVIKRYRIQLKVKDRSGMATFILFDSKAKKITQHISERPFEQMFKGERIWKMKL
ncbi:hypothetical protein SO802_015034, partial [Lithocarpus litseifolius]